MATRDHLVSGGVIVLVGLLATAVPVFDIVEDTFVARESPLSTLIENVALLLLGLGVVGVGLWLVRIDWKGRYVRTVARLTLANVVGVAAVISMVVLIQLRLQDQLKPFIIAADAVVIGALGGVLLGLRTAQQERATDEAAAERDRFQALFENVPNPIVGVEFVDRVPLVRAVNPAFVEVFGFDRRTIVGEDLREYIVPPEESLEPVERPMTTESVDATDAWDREIVELETVNGIREFVRLSAPVDQGPAHDGYAIYIDVTAQRQRRERLRVLSRTLRHNIRNQLSVVQGGAAELASRLDGRDAEWAALIEAAATDLLETSQEARHIERQIAGEDEPIPVDLSAAVREQAAALRQQYDCTVTVDAPEVAYGSASGSFSDALGAVCRNAVVHNDTDDPTVELSVVEALDGTYYDVRIADDGPGIPQGEIEVVRDPESRSQTQHLDGLGLWTARWVIQNSGGELEFAPNSPRGTIVTLRVPKADDGEIPAGDDG